LQVPVAVSHPPGQFPESAEHRGASAQRVGTTSSLVDGASSASQTCWTHRLTNLTLWVGPPAKVDRAGIKSAQSEKVHKNRRMALLNLGSPLAPLR